MALNVSMVAEAHRSVQGTTCGAVLSYCINVILANTRLRQGRELKGRMEGGDLKEGWRGAERATGNKMGHCGMNRK